MKRRKLLTPRAAGDNAGWRHPASALSNPSTHFRLESQFFPALVWHPCICRISSSGSFYRKTFHFESVRFGLFMAFGWVV